MNNNILSHQRVSMKLFLKLISYFGLKQNNIPLENNRARISLPIHTLLADI